MQLRSESIKIVHWSLLYFHSEVYTVKQLAAVLSFEASRPLPEGWGNGFRYCSKIGGHHDGVSCGCNSCHFCRWVIQRVLDCLSALCHVRMCHVPVCRQKKEGKKLQCTRCDLFWCGGCLDKRYGENLLEVTA